MVATRIIDMASHVCKVQALVIATSYQGLHMSIYLGTPQAAPTQ